MKTRPLAPRGRVASAIMESLHEHKRRVLLLPEDWDLIDAITGGRGGSEVAVHRLARAGQLRKIRRGAYAVRSENGSLRVAALDLIGALARGPHLVTAGHALAAHQLSDQSFRKIVVVVPNARRPWSWVGVRVHYVRMPAKQIWGGRSHRRNGLSTIVALPERAVLDSLAHPSWGVSIAQVVEAIDRAGGRDPEFFERLAVAAGRYGNAMLCRRLGFLVERTHGPTAAQPFIALRGSTHASTDLLLRAPLASAELDPRWHVSENVPFELLVNHRGSK